MKVLADFHHEELYESLRFLIEKRMGWHLYRPVGMDWYHEGFWNVHPHITTAEQYLQVSELDPETVSRMDAEDNFRKLNKNIISSADGVINVASNLYSDAYHRGITLQGFKDRKFDIIISSMPQHVAPFNRLITEFQPDAKHVFQIGNNWQAPSGVKNILTSSAMTSHPAGKNCVFYHQEFDLNTFCFQTSKNPHSVCNMQHIMSHRGLFDKLGTLLPDWKFTAFGAQNGAGCPGPAMDEIATEFHNYGWLWHVKRGGDGYGYNIHHAAATGTPILTKKSYFRGMTGDKLLIDGVTCIDIDVHGLEGAAEIMKSIDYSAWQKAIHENFSKNVDFDAEHQRLKEFFDRLL